MPLTHEGSHLEERSMESIPGRVDRRQAFFLAAAGAAELFAVLTLASGGKAKTETAELPTYDYDDVPEGRIALGTGIRLEIVLPTGEKRIVCIRYTRDGKFFECDNVHFETHAFTNFIFTTKDDVTNVTDVKKANGRLSITSQPGSASLLAQTSVWDRERLCTLCSDLIMKETHSFQHNEGIKVVFQKVVPPETDSPSSSEPGTGSLVTGNE